MKLNIVLSFFTIFSSVYAQIDETDIVVNNSSTNVQTEIDIAVSKSNKDHIIIGWNTLRPGQKSQQGVVPNNQGWALSYDGGLTWAGNSNAFPHLNEPDIFGDPVVGWNANQNPFMFTMMPHGKVGFTIHSSSNWNNVVIVPSLNSTSETFDKIMGIAVDDNLMSNGHNNIYLAGTNFDSAGSSGINHHTLIFTRMLGSTNAFTTPQVLVNDSRHSQGADIKIGPNNKLFISWTDYGPDKVFPGSNIGFARSIDHGANFNYTTSTAFGICGIRIENWGVASYCNTRVTDFPSMAVDRSCLQYRGRIYICWADQKNCNAAPSNKGSVIKMRYSDDDGDTWSAPISLSKPEHSHAWFPRMAVDDRTGLITVAYFTYENQGECDQTNTFLSYSTNGGNNWSHLKISDVSQEPKEIIDNGLGYAGDYIGIAVHDNRCYIAWHDRRSGSYQVLLSKVEFNLPTKIDYARGYTFNNSEIISVDKSIFAKGKIDMLPGIQLETQTGFLHLKSETAIELSNDAYINNPTAVLEIGPIDCYDIGTTQTDFVHNPVNINIDSLKRHIGPNNNMFNIYPNPAMYSIKISANDNFFNHFDFELIDNLGRKVMYGNSGSNSFATLNLEYLPSGMYYVLINKRSYGKIFISR